MKIPDNKQYIFFGGAFVLANKLQVVADKKVHGLSTKQWFLLRNLSDLPKEPLPTLTMLAKETDTSRQNVTKMLDVLQRQGYVELKDNAQDRRSQCVVLSVKGEQKLREVAQEAGPFLKELFSDIDAEECRIAADVVIKIIDKLGKMQEDTE